MCFVQHHTSIQLIHTNNEPNKRDSIRILCTCISILKSHRIYTILIYYTAAKYEKMGDNSIKVAFATSKQRRQAEFIDERNINISFKKQKFIKARELARKGSESEFIGPEPVVIAPQCRVQSEWLLKPTR